jgi:hypothetical protein
LVILRPDREGSWRGNWLAAARGRLMRMLPARTILSRDAGAVRQCGDLVAAWKGQRPRKLGEDHAAGGAPCEEGLVQRPDSVAVTGLVRGSAAGLGFVFGVVIVLTPSTFRDAPLWPVWASLAVALTGAAGLVFGYGLARWAELSALHPIGVRDVAVPVAALLTVAVLTGLTGLVLTVTAHRAGAGWSAVRGWALMSAALLGAIPAVAVMYGVRRAASSEPTAGTRGEQADALMALRRLLQRLLAAVGSLVALSTLALGAALALQQSLPAGPVHSGPAQLPPQTVLIFGGVGSALVALAYGPASTALKDRGQRLCDELFPLHDADEAAAILSRAEDRTKLGQLLGVDRSITADLQTGLAILGPLIASAAAAFLPH